ncbi:Ral GTPase-activating protein subunit beta [Clonorchis sinensis]|nr:Ral GTPase-activating protein subunit beta [Clonorchis sinensis]
MAMVCIPVQFKGLVLRCLIPVANNPKDPPTMNDLRRQLAYLLCDSLEREKDPVNFQMLLTTSLALLEDMAADEQSSLALCPPNQTGEVNRKRLDTTFGFYHQLIPCLCTLLVTDWGSDSVAQYILEILTGLSTVQIWSSNRMLYKETVRHICEFITKQCQRESRDHKRQLHSIIVAAYSCLSSWIVAHARHVLFDRDCLQIVLGTIELGICGQKSKATSVPIAKADKKPTPASKRVQDAAEWTLSVLLSLAGAYPGVTGSATTCSRLVEDQLIQALAPEDEVRRQPELLRELRQQFQYFWSEPGVLLGILEVAQCREVLKSRGVSLNKTEELELPKTIVVLRGPFGRHVWAVRMRQLPIDDPEASASPVQLAPPSRPKAWGCFLERLLVTIDRNKTMEALTFPASISDIPLVDADSSIGSLEQVGGAPESQSRVEINTIKSLIMSQSAKIEEVGFKCLKQRLNAPFPDPLVEIHPPSSDASFQVGRMLLTNLGYLSANTFAMMELDALKPVGNSEKPAPNPAVPPAQMKGGQAALGSSQLIQSSNTELSAGAAPLDRDGTLQACQTFFALDPQNSDIPSIVDSLDRLPTRTADTLLVFYVGAGQSKVDVILSNMKNWNQLSNEFHAFIRNLGSFVEVAKHPGWTGCIETSYHAVDTSVGFTADPTVSSRSTVTTPSSAPDGHELIVYSADALTEFACVCPSDYYLAPVTSFEPEKAEISRRASMLADPPTGGTHRLVQQQSSTTVSGEPGGDPTGGRVAVVWLENWEDGPVTAGPDNPGWAIQQMTSQLFGCPVTIYIHPLSSKLYRVGVLRAPGRVFDAGPLINGSVLSHRVLGSFVRQTVTNISRRRRLASDQFQPPHVRRKHRICELEQAYRTQLSRSQSIAKQTSYCPQVVLKLFTAAA